MLANSRSLMRLATDASYEQRLSGPLQLLQEFRWRESYGVLKANLLFLFDGQEAEGVPYLILIIEDCLLELCDDNLMGKEFCFELRFKTTGRKFIMAADSFSSLGRWVSTLTITPLEYIHITKQSFQDQIDALTNAAVENASPKTTS